MISALFVIKLQYFKNERHEIKMRVKNNLLHGKASMVQFFCKTIVRLNQEHNEGKI